MICQRVLGSPCENRSSGLASAPISLVTCSLSSSISPLGLVERAHEGDKGGDTLPLTRAGRPTQPPPPPRVAHQRRSTSIVPRRWPATLITSSTRPMIQK